MHGTRTHSNKIFKVFEIILSSVIRMTAGDGCSVCPESHHIVSISGQRYNVGSTRNPFAGQISKNGNGSIIIQTGNKMISPMYGNQPMGLWNVVGCKIHMK